MRNKLLVFAFSGLILAGCGSGQAISTPTGAQVATQGRLGAVPEIRQTGETPVQWRRFAWGSIQAPYYPTILKGPDNNLWYDDYSGTALIRMNMFGNTVRFPLVSFNPTSFTVGADHKFYAGDVNLALIDVVTTAGVETHVAIPSGDKIGYNTMTLGPDGNVWFTEYSHVGKVTPGGVVTEYAFSDATTNNYYDQIVTGPDAKLWVSEYFAGTVDKVTPGTGAMTSITLGCNPYGIISAQGSLWAGCTNNTLVQITTAGVVTPYHNAFGFPGSGKYLTVGPDGNPWFGTSSGNVIGEFNPSSGSMSFFYPPANYGTDSALTAGPDGNVWTVDSSSHAVNVYILSVITTNPTSLTFPAGSQTKTFTVVEPGATAWTATSSNTAVATVAQGSPASSFKVTSVAAGTARIAVNDTKGNSFVVLVTVQ